jgi:hypothetical protein
VNCISHTIVENLKQFAFNGDKSRVVRRISRLIKVVPTWKKFEKRCFKVKVNFTREQATKAQRGNRSLAITLALDGVGGQRHARAALLLAMNRYPLYRRLGGLPGQCWRLRKISGPSSRSAPLYWLRYPGPQHLSFSWSNKAPISVCLFRVKSKVWGFIR